MHTPHRLAEGALLRSPVRTAALALASVALMLLSVLLPALAAPAHAAVTGYRVTTQYIGGGSTVNIRVAASRDSAIAYTARNRQPLSIECQTVGGRLGFSRYADNRTWDRLSDGRYIHDVVTTTPGANVSETVPGGGYVVWSAGIPRCPIQTPTAPPATQPPASTAPSTPAPAGVTGYSATTQWIGGGATINVRRTPSTSAEISTTLPTGSPVTIACQQLGSPLGFSQYANNRTWDRLTDGTYVHDVLTTTPGGTRVYLSDGGYTFFTPSIPQCDPQPAATATPAPDAVGETGTYPAADAKDCSAQFGKYSWCVNGGWYSPDRRFAYRNCTDYVAWRLHLTWSDVSSNNSGNAIDWRQGWINRGRPVSTTPKVGAVAWWGRSKSAWGHVGVVIAVNGDGTARIAQFNGAGDGRYSETTERAEAYLY